MLRLLEVLVPGDRQERVREVLDRCEDCSYLDMWGSGTGEDSRTSIIHILAEADQSEPISDLLSEEFSGSERFRITTLPVEATLPRPEEEEKVQQGNENSGKSARIGREELYSDIADAALMSGEYMVLVAISAIVAAVGLLRDNIAVVIGAMVIAPLLGPSVALSLGTTLGDISLIRKSIRTALIGIGIAFSISLVMGLAIEIDPGGSEIASRTTVSHWDVMLALAVGTAGALAFTTGVSSALVGVMVAVALLPPLVTFGMLIGAGAFPSALGAALLTMVNLVSINLAGVATFVIQGIRPANWWEADRAKKRTRSALILWFSVLAVLVFLIEAARRLGTWS